MKNNFKVYSEDKIKQVMKTLSLEVKQSELLSNNWGDYYAIAKVVVNNIKSDAEIHKKAVDVFFVTKGKGKIILGGSLVKSKVVGSGELIGKSIKGGTEYQIKEGDVIDIPANVPHQFDVRNNRLELLIIKINLKK